MAQFNLYSDISSIAQKIQEDAIFVVREMGQMQGLVTVFTDASGLTPRTGYKYNQMSAKVVAEADDLTSSAFTPSADQTLTPFEIGLQAVISDSRVESDGRVPDNYMADVTRELGLAALDYVESSLIGDMASLTGGTIGAAGSAITWSYLAAAIAQARYVNKSNSIPLACVLHEYQWAVLAKSASIAGATVAAVAPNFQEQITSAGFVAQFMGVPIYKVFGGLVSTNFTGGVFPRISLAIDWRRPVRIRPERDESRRALELNLSAVYAHGVWQPQRGIQFTFDASAPTA